ncbi:unnamed protein product, partial [Soboliphyme baturini]|uniref:Homeobox domain-containing protein n=1 Tax=Soboliphyme baturini TaxID=241478 RepID=A0A183IZB9_9BILA
LHFAFVAVIGAGGRRWRRPGARADFSGLTNLLLPPFRKPKRNRTAFSPFQLVELERAFELNHYVIGGERKDLACRLQLSETQVKVWFQNRRTKHKRVKVDKSSTPTQSTPSIFWSLRLKNAAEEVDSLLHS